MLLCQNLTQQLFSSCFAKAARNQDEPGIQQDPSPEKRQAEEEGFKSTNQGSSNYLSQPTRAPINIHSLVWRSDISEVGWSPFLILAAFLAEGIQSPAARGVPQFPKRLCFDLANPFSGYGELLANFFKS